jgi:hypothetical protein
MTPLATMRAVVMMTSLDISAIAAVAVWKVTAVIVSLAFFCFVFLF